MAKLGTKKRPATVSVQTLEAAEEIMDLCDERGWKVIVGVDPDQPEDVADLDHLLGAITKRTEALTTASRTVGRNSPCSCGSGRRYKRCCGQPPKRSSLRPVDGTEAV